MPSAAGDVEPMTLPHLQWTSRSEVPSSTCFKRRDAEAVSKLDVPFLVASGAHGPSSSITAMLWPEGLLKKR